MSRSLMLVPLQGRAIAKEIMAHRMAAPHLGSRRHERRPDGRLDVVLVPYAVRLRSGCIHARRLVTKSSIMITSGLLTAG